MLRRSLSPLAAQTRPSQGQPLAQLLGRTAFVLGLFALLVGPSCASLADSEGSAGGPFGGAGGSCVGCGGDPGDGAALDVPVVDSSGGANVGGAPACGVGECQPDNPTACLGFQPDAGGASGVAGAAGSGAGTSGAAGASGAAGTAGTAGADAADAAADRAQLPAQTPPSYRGLPPGEDAVYACHIRRGETGELGGSGSLVRRCEPAGAKASGEPCTSSGDCAPGLGCVGEENLGRCRAFCCEGGAGCADGTFCAKRALRDDALPDGEQLSVPVCAAADNCSLGEPYPCDNTDPNAGCVCRAGAACTVVRADGTTSCVPPGAGVAGQACPCAAGHICSQASGQCVQICKLGASSPTCGSGRCQAPAKFPEGYGVCVASDYDSGS